MAKAKAKKDMKSEPKPRRKKGSGTIIIRNGQYFIRWREDGKVKQEKTGLSATKANRSAAEDMLAKKTTIQNLLTRQEQIAVLLKEQEEIQDKIARLKDIATTKLTLGEMAKAFADSPRRKDCSEKQLEIYLQQIGAFVSWVGDESKPVADVDEALAEKYAAHLGKQFSGSTYNKHINCLTMAFKALGRAEGIKVNPWLDLPRKRLETHVRRVLERPEIDAILAAATGELKDLILVGLHTGLRLGDAAHLRWENFKDDGSVVVKTTKTGATVCLPSANLLTALGRKKEKGLVVPHIADEYERNNANLCREIGKVFKAAGIATNSKKEGWLMARPDATFHSLRHTFVTRAIEAGISVAIVRAIVGHTTETMTEHYTHVGGEAVLAAFQKAGL